MSNTTTNPTRESLITMLEGAGPDYIHLANLIPSAWAERCADRIASGRENATASVLFASQVAKELGVPFQVVMETYLFGTGKDQRKLITYMIHLTGKHIVKTN